jgi:hypothetical protein
LALLVLVAPVTGALAQAPDSLPPARPTADETLPRAEALPIPEKPSVHQFRLSLEVNAFNWDDEADVDDGLMVAFDVERDLAPFLAGRGSLAYGVTEIRPRSGGGSRDVRLYLPELDLLPQHTFRLSGETRLTPYLIVGFGSLVADPKGEGSTRSQNAFSFGGGTRFRFTNRLGIRGEVKRYLIKLEDPLDPTSQDSESVHVWRLGAAFSYSL